MGRDRADHDRGTTGKPRSGLILGLGLAWAVTFGPEALAQSSGGIGPIGPSLAADSELGSVDPPSSAPIARPWDEVVGNSLFGRLRPDLWRPLGLSGLFREGWDEQYAPAPDLGGEGAPRQTWIGNADGAFYRLFVFSFGYARSLPGNANANAYNGGFFLFTPISRRFEIGWFVPFVTSTPDFLGPAGGNRYWTDAGDLTVAPRVLLAEDRRYSITTNLYARLPTGSVRNGNGAASLSPDLEFWLNPPGRWVLRGGLGVTVPTNETRARLPLLSLAPFTGFNASPSSLTSFDARFAIGKYLTPADARILPSLVPYLSANLHTALSGGHATYFSLTPGFRFGLGNEWYFLGGIEVPLVGPQPFQTLTTFQIIKNF
jgi:hypothetical protein